MRREFPARVKSAAFKRCVDSYGVPRCEGEITLILRDENLVAHKDRTRCDLELKAGNIFYDHVKADGLGGEPILSNCAVLCRTCHDAKTFGQDNPRMTKADNQRKRHYGIKARKGLPMPGTKASGLRKRMDGTVERR